MKKAILLSASVAALIAGAGLAAEPKPGMKLGINAKEIGATLDQHGYRVIEIEQDDRRIEVEAVKDAQRFKFYIDPATGVAKKTTHYGNQANAERNTAIRRVLEDNGYELVRIEQEHGKVEAYALKDGRKWELELDPESLQILRSELED